MPVLLILIVLGFIQGSTEFLPISSSGHLVLMTKVFEHSFNFKAFDKHLVNVVLHFGTMLATIIVFWGEILEIFKAVFSRRLLKIRSLDNLKEDNMLWLAFIIIVGSVPTGLIGLFLKDYFKLLENSLFAVSLALITTGFVLFSTRFIKRVYKEDYNQISIWDSLLIGFVQGLAITPGISRSGITIGTGLWQGIHRKKIGHFSFLLSLPAIFGATLLEVMKIKTDNIPVIPIIIGFLIALVIGYIALKWLLRFINQGKLHHFMYYCWFIGIVALIASFYY